MATAQPSSPISFPTPLFEQKLAQKKVANECDRQRLLQETLQWLEQNAPKFGIEQGYLFCSTTQPGQFSQFSDLDLALDSLSQGEPFGLISHLSTFLNREVDLAPLDQCHFAHKIQREGVRWSATKLRD